MNMYDLCICFVPCCICSRILIRYESWVVLFGRDSHFHKVTFRIYIYIFKNVEQMANPRSKIFQFRKTMQIIGKNTEFFKAG